MRNITYKLEQNPSDTENVALKADLEECLKGLEDEVAKLQAELDAQPVPEPPKWSKENHPAFKKAAPAEVVAPTFKVGDKVNAKWSGDRKLYPARITSITGSSASPVYVVIFDIDGTTETVRGGDIKPLLNPGHKRNADGATVSSVASTAPTPIFKPAPTGSKNVISAAANINPALASQAKKEPSKVSDGPVRPAKIPKKMKANKELEAGKNKWQDWNKRAKVGKVGKESMFRTGEGFGARGESSLHLRGALYMLTTC